MLGWFWNDPLPVGTPAPDFTLKDEMGHEVTLRKLRGSNVVLIWYPGDDTSTCTKQLCEMRDNWAVAQKKNIRVFGVNQQSAESHVRFREKYQFPFPLLVDPGQRVGDLYHTKSLIAKRTVYLIGKDGVIRFAQRGKPSVQEVLAAADR
jgi:thioredoxin-dependent peroxiredoxin